MAWQSWENWLFVYPKIHYSGERTSRVEVQCRSRQPLHRPQSQQLHRLRYQHFGLEMGKTFSHPWACHVSKTSFLAHLMQGCLRSNEYYYPEHLSFQSKSLSITLPASIYLKCQCWFILCPSGTLLDLNVRHDSFFTFNFYLFIDKF